MFYPRLHESKTVSGNKVKIEDCDVVFGANGEKVDMKHLKSEMETCRNVIAGQAVYLSPYLHHFTPVYTWEIGTMATDGTHLFVNPLFADKLTWEEKIFVIMHEIIHCLLQHVERGKGKRAMAVTADGQPTSVWNLAADYEVNPMVVDTYGKMAGFTKEFVLQRIHGLWEDKYAGDSASGKEQWAAEQIYNDLLETMPKLPEKKTGENEGGKGSPQQGQGDGQGSPQPIELEPGMKVRIKKTGEQGVVTKVNPDGTFDVEQVVEESAFSKFYPRLHQMLKENAGNTGTFSREELVPILPPGQGGGGGGGTPISGEYEIEGEGKFGGDENPNNIGSGKGMKDGKEVETEGSTRQSTEGDGGNSGSIIDPERGKKIAENAGHTPDYDTQDDVNTKWRQNAEDLMKKMHSEFGSTGRGNEPGSVFLKTLKKILKGELNWKQLLKRYVGNALAPDTITKMGNKKYLWKGDYRRFEKRKQDALKKIVVLVDTSGSMSEKDLERIIYEINGIIFQKRAQEIIIAFFDNTVDENSVQRIKKTGRPYLGNPSSNGGTNFQNALDWVKRELKDNISLLVFFTDGICDMPKRPRYAKKFIWVVYGNEDFKEKAAKEGMKWGRIVLVPENA